jgi:hypothetical protein
MALGGSTSILFASGCEILGLVTGSGFGPTTGLFGFSGST